MKKLNYLALVVLSSLPAMVGCGSPATELSDTRTLKPTTFAEWKDSVRVTADKDIYAVGDLVSPFGLVGDEEARWYYENRVERAGALTVHNGQTGPGTPINVSAFLPESVLVYCIDKTGLEAVVDDYGLPSGTDLYGYVDEAFGAAAAVWNATLGVSIQIDASRDRTCVPKANDNITWYVRPMALQGTLEYLTFVLHPNHNKASYDNREFLILDYLIQRPFPGSFIAANDPDWESIFSMEGLLLRALANGLGFIDESNRGGVTGDSGTNIWSSSCRDTSVGGVFLSDADPYSVTTHPQAMKPLMDKPNCAGYRPSDYVLSYTDAMGMACQYREKNIFYYCSQVAQRIVASSYPEDCSPYPMYTNGPGDCGIASDPDNWQDQGVAKRFHAAVVAALAD